MITKRILNISIFGFCFSLILQIIISNTLAVRGNQFMLLSDEKADLVKQVSELRLKDSALSSLSNIEAKAKQLGFVSYTGYLATVNTSGISSVAVVADLAAY